MSVTRLLVLGAVRIFQPAHGYLVRRELITWRAAEWAHLNPGSIYNALRSLTKDGMLLEEAKTPAASGPKASYRLTADGETEFQTLVRTALWELHPHEPSWLHAGLSFWWALERSEVIAALEARAAQLRVRITASDYAVDSLPRMTGTPEHVVEHLWLQTAHLHGELEWVEQAIERLRSGAYGFLGEEPHRRNPAIDPFGPAPSAMDSQKNIQA